MKQIREMELRTVVLLVGVAIGFGIAVHEVFFLVALAVAFIAIAQAVIQQAKLTHRHP
jgi:hypothetical protein